MQWVHTHCKNDHDLKYREKRHQHLNFSVITALPVTIGMQQTAYTVGEVDDYQLACFEVLSGDIDGREIVIDYSTASGTASMNIQT